MPAGGGVAAWLLVGIDMLMGWMLGFDEEYRLFCEADAYHNMRK